MSQEACEFVPSADAETVLLNLSNQSFLNLKNNFKSSFCIELEKMQFLLVS